MEVIKTTEQLMAYINEQLALAGIAPLTEHSEVHWVVAVYEAGNIQDLNLRELAGLLVDGFSAINDAFVDDWLVSVFDDEDTPIEDKYDTIKGAIQSVYGVRDGKKVSRHGE